MQIDKELLEDKVLYKLEGEMDTNTAQLVEDAIKPHMETGPSTVVVDLTKVPYISSAGLRVILVLYKVAVKTGRQLVIHNPNAMSMELFQMTNFTDFLTIT